MLRVTLLDRQERAIRRLVGEDRFKADFVYHTKCRVRYALAGAWMVVRAHGYCIGDIDSTSASFISRHLKGKKLDSYCFSTTVKITYSAARRYLVAEIDVHMPSYDAPELVKINDKLQNESDDYVAPRQPTLWDHVSFAKKQLNKIRLPF